MKKRISLLLALAMVISLSACGKQQTSQSGTPSAASTASEAKDPVIWKISCIDAEGSEYMDAFTNMWKRIEEETNGYIKVEMYYSSQLGEEGEVLEGIQLGTIQGAQMATSVMANYSEYFYVNDLPFLFENFEHCDAFMKTDAAKTMSAALEEYGFYVWYWGILGYKQPNLVKGCITSLEDCKGLKWRVMDTAVQVKTVESLGANPVVIAYNEVYSALGNNTIDCWMNDAVAFKNLSIYEVAPYFTEIPLFTSMQTCVVSKAAYDALPQEYQDIVYNVIMEEEPEVIRTSWAQNQATLDWLKEEGFKEWNAIEDTAPFFEAVQPVYDWMRSEHPATAEIITAINDLR